MPVLSRFNGIVIKMYFLQSEHNPPHFHAMYNKYVAAIDCRTGEILEGMLPTNEHRLIKKWINQNKEEILHVWNTQEFKRIPPLL